MGDISAIKIDHLFKLYKKGKIGEVYKEIYGIADDIAIHETNQYHAKLIASIIPSDLKTKNPLIEIDIKATDYKKERVEYHLKNMLNILNNFLKEKEK